MNFSVTARVSTQQFSHHYNSMIDALDQGLSLQASGLSDVRIVDNNGHARTPSAIYQLLFGPKEVVAPISGQTTTVLALVA